jgi:hypothetical protein
MTFDIRPSADFTRLTAQRDELAKRFRQPGLSIEQCQAISDQLANVHAALAATPEQQFLAEVRDAEHQAYEQNLAAELARHGRMTIGLRLAAERQSLDEAIMDQAFSSVAIDEAMDEPLVVVADMRMMSAAQVAQCLRAMADSIEDDGLAIYCGPSSDGSGDEWWCKERVDGTLWYSRSGCD